MTDISYKIEKILEKTRTEILALATPIAMQISAKVKDLREIRVNLYSDDNYSPDTVIINKNNEEKYPEELPDDIQEKIHDLEEILRTYAICGGNEGEVIHKPIKVVLDIY